MNGDLSPIMEMLPFLIPIIILQLVLLVIALIDISKREHVAGGNKVVWILVIVLFQIFGSLIYFLFGRRESNNNDRHQDQ